MLIVKKKASRCTVYSIMYNVYSTIQIITFVLCIDAMEYEFPTASAHEMNSGPIKSGKYGAFLEKLPEGAIGLAVTCSANKRASLDAEHHLYNVSLL